MKLKWQQIGFTFLSLFCIVLYSCSQSNEKRSIQSLDQTLRAGEQLAQKYCGTCHLPVSPGLLDKETWLNRVLPVMAPKLGIRVWRQNNYYPAGGSQEGTVVSYNEWIQIVNYFEQEAPEALKAADRPAELREGWSIFSIKKPDSTQYPREVAATTMVKIDPDSKNIYTSDANENALVRWDHKLRSKKVMSFSHPAVDISFLDNPGSSRDAILTTIGTMKAEDISRGVVQQVSLEVDTAYFRDAIATELTRPLKTLGGDFNRDGLQDWIVCVFGHNTGGLYLFQQEADQSYTQKTIREVPGAEDAVVDDFNGDGWPDLMVLFAYDDEGIWMFINDGNGGFETKNLLRFPPVFGSTSFELVDFNNDGLRDILYTNGDNADFSPILKPYHGMYIYLNQGGFNFEEAYFYPVNGATEAVVEDFDLDGDVDIATIALFADFTKNPSESFIYFEQKEELKFIPHSIPISEHGRWIDIDTGDFDSDGDTDIVLGNFSRKFMNEEDFESSWDTGTPLLLLINQTE